MYYSLFLASFFLLFLFSFMFIQDRSIILDILLPVSFLTDCTFSFLFDFISIMFFFSVSVIARIVFLYSKFYIPNFGLYKDFLGDRFYHLLFLFVLSISILVFSGSWFIVILGWDGLGLVSFLLVIYYNDVSSLRSGLLTVFINRIGDCFFILSFIFFLGGGWNFNDFFLSNSSLVAILFIFFGLSTKRAQVPFSSWLPAAIAAPTPVSSLVHSSTLVTAGVYLFIRFNYLIEDIFIVAIVLSLITILLAGVFALFELDFKKLVAMSTLSQLGFIVFSVSAGYWIMSLFHIIFHAFFKRILFLSTGNLIHYVYGAQDSRLFGGLANSFFSKVFFSISCLSLIGFPFSMGFYSKDFLLGSFFFINSHVYYYIFLFSCMCTVAYRLRLIVIGFSIYPSFFNSFSFVEERLFFFPVIVLYRGCVFLGFVFYFYTPIVLFSFLESAAGLLVIFLGGYLLVSYRISFKIIFFINIGYLFNISTSPLSSLIKKFIYRLDYTWSEFTGGAAAYYILSIFSFYRKPVLSTSFLPVFIIFIFFLVIK